MEHIAAWGPGRYNVATHWDGYGKEHKSAGNEHLFYGPTPDGWHVFGMLWEPGPRDVVLRWNQEGGMERTTGWARSPPTSSSAPSWEDGVSPRRKRGPPRRNLPASVEVDYVRAWQRNDLAIAASKVDKSVLLPENDPFQSPPLFSLSRSSPSPMQRPGGDELAGFFKKLKAGEKQTVVTYGTSLTEHGAWVAPHAGLVRRKFPARSR